jgi:xylulokinase
MGIDVDTIRLSGGGARSRFWRQMQADVYDTPTAVINADEGPAYGVAILAGVGTGVWRDVPQACGAVISEIEKLKPDAAAAKQYARSYRQYKRLYPALKDEFPHMAKL